MRVLEAVEEGLLQMQGIAPNSKQDGIFRVLCENANGFNNRISGNQKIAKVLDIKEDLDIDCLLYCEHRLNLRHKENVFLCHGKIFLLVSQENISSGEYPLFRPLFIAVNKHNKEPKVRGFIKFLLGPEGQRIISEEGTVNLAEGKSLKELWNIKTESMGNAWQEKL